MSIEAGVLIDLSGSPIYWHTPNDASSIALPDSPTLWDAIWQQRQRLLGFAHTHPGSGTPSPSSTDLTTFAAIEIGLGRRLTWWILTQNAGISLYWSNEKDRYVEVPWSYHEIVLAPWISELRKLSR